ncbi:MAG: FHA domain-containing protein [bacterium]
MTWLAFGEITRELRGEIVVGSANDAGWPVAAPGLNPRHFVVNASEQTVSIRPASSDVVLVVNGAQLLDGSAVLKDGDAIAAGDALFCFGEHAPPVAPTDLSPLLNAFLVDDAGCIAYPLRIRSTSIGRDASNVVAIRDATASRFHAEVRREAGGFTIRSMGSAGTNLNGRALPGPRLLSDGDTIEVAFAKLRFTLSDPPPDFEIAERDAGENDERSRRPTLGSGRSPVEANNLAERDTKWLKLVVAVLALLVLAAVLWVQRYSR